MREHEVSSPSGARRRRKRIGRGDATGKGTYAGRGMKGQKSRSGKFLRGFEGGQMSLVKGLPTKRGFTNIFRVEYATVKLERLADFPQGTRITPELLHQQGLVRNRKLPIKILGDGELTVPVTVAVHKLTASARGKIEAAGGSVEEYQP